MKGAQGAVVMGCRKAATGTCAERTLMPGPRFVDHMSRTRTGVGLSVRERPRLDEPLRKQQLRRRQPCRQCTRGAAGA